MVDSVRSYSGANLDPAKGNKSANTRSASDTTTASEPTSAPKTETVTLDLSSNAKIESLSKEPPIDLELVSEIRQRVAAGEYPIDKVAIASKMFDAIKNG